MATSSSPAKAGCGKTSPVHGHRPGLWPMWASGFCWSAPMRPRTWTNVFWTAPLLPTTPPSKGAPLAWLVLNIDPQAPRKTYRARVLAKWSTTATKSATRLEGGCRAPAPPRIASFDEFSSLLANNIPDTTHHLRHGSHWPPCAPAGGLPKAWSGFLAGNDQWRLLPGPPFRLEDARRPASTPPCRFGNHN